MGQYGKYFEYNGESSERYNLVTGGYSVNEYEFGLQRNVDRTEMNKYRSYTYTYGTIYDDVLSFPILFMKDPCKFSNNDELRFTRQEIREINAWLTSPHYPKLFHMYDQDPIEVQCSWHFDESESKYTATIISSGRGYGYLINTDGNFTVTNLSTGETYSNPRTKVYASEGDELSIVVDAIAETIYVETGELDEEGVPITEEATVYQMPTVKITESEDEYDYFGLFTEVSSEDTGIFVLEFQFECDSPFAWSKEKSITLTGQGGTVYNNGDEYDDYIYPKITVEPLSSNFFLLSDENWTVNTGEGTLSTTITGDGGSYKIHMESGYSLTITGGESPVTIQGGATELVTTVNGTDYTFAISYHNAVPEQDWKYKMSVKSVIRLINVNDNNRYMEFAVQNQNTLYIDCKRNIFKDTANSFVSLGDLGYKDEDFIYWMRLAHGANNIVIEGAGEVTFTYREPIKVGGY